MLQKLSDLVSDAFSFDARPHRTPRRADTEAGPTGTSASSEAPAVGPTLVPRSEYRDASSRPSNGASASAASRVVKATAPP